MVLLERESVFQSEFPKIQLQFLHLLVSAAQKDHSDSRLTKQKEPPPEDQTCGSEETGAGRLHPGVNCPVAVYPCARKIFFGTILFLSG